LSDPQPSVQLARIRLLYKDLHDAISTLVPSDHPVLTTLSFPPSPTSSPLTSTTMHLREVLLALRERCAPARDSTIDAVLLSLDDLSPASDVFVMATSLVDAIRKVMAISETMKDDLSQFVLGSMSDNELNAVVVTQAKMRERNFVLKYWPHTEIQSRWRDWISRENDISVSGSGVQLWIRRLLKALNMNTPVSCLLPYPADHTKSSASLASEESNNQIPPPFFFDIQTLLYTQNLLQALVIAASLRALTRLPFDDTGTASDFMQRIWTLLKAEIDGELQADGTKLVNLADEVVRARTSVESTLDDLEETKLRDAVDRTLKPRDPVFLLLQKRLADSLCQRLEEDITGSRAAVSIPNRMRSGLASERPGKRLRLGALPALAPPENGGAASDRPFVVKGFEDSVLRDAVIDTFERIRTCVRWTRSVWEGIIEFN
jgi:hypothetical protein